MQFPARPKTIIAEIAQLVERNLAKVEVAGPSPVFRSRKWLIISRLSTIFLFPENTEDGRNVCHNKQHGGNRIKQNGHQSS